VSPKPWSRASGGPERIGKAEEEAVAVFYGDESNAAHRFLVVA
jgi:hypothetical protein